MSFFKSALFIGFLISVILLNITFFFKPRPVSAEWTFIPGLSPTPPTPTATSAPTNAPLPIPTPQARAVTYTVTGYVFLDVNNNGVKDAAEQCYNGQITVLLNNSRSQTYTQNTACTSKYTFTGLAAGSYTVTVAQSSFPGGYTFSTTNPFGFTVPEPTRIP